MSRAPQTALVASTTLYPTLLHILTGPSPNPHRLSASIRAVSTLHSSLTTLLALYLLSHLPPPSSNPPPPTSTTLHNDHPDDSTNPLITTRSNAANTLTAIETGYLLSAIPSLLREARYNGKKASKTMLAHHAGIGSALLVLQWYILRGKEKGIFVIVMFLLMNGSTPLWNLRWFVRNLRTQERVGRGVVRVVDVAFVVAFLVARVLLVPGVLKVYGRAHGMGVLETWTRGLRWQCRVGTGALWAGNLAWWVEMVRGMVKSGGKGRKGD